MCFHCGVTLEVCLEAIVSRASILTVFGRRVPRSSTLTPVLQCQVSEYRSFDSCLRLFDAHIWQARKAPIQRLVDTIAGKFTWLVFASSVSTLLFWGAVSPWVLGSATGEASHALSGALEGTAGGGSWALGMRLAVDVCLVACPCSLGLATPTAVMVSGRTGKCPAVEGDGRGGNVCFRVF